MHVLIVPSWYPTDENDLNGVFFREQAKALERAGHKVGVIAPMFQSPRRGLSALETGFGNSFWQDGSVPTYRAHSIYISSKLPHFDLWRWCRRGNALFERYVSQHGRPDILHAHSLLCGGILAARISERTAIPFGVTEHSTTYTRNMVRRWQIPEMVSAASKASFRLAVSNPLAHSIQTQLGSADWSILPNMLDPMFRKKSAKIRPIRTSQLQLISIASLLPKKGFDLLLESVAIARNRGVKVELKIGGDGPMRRALETQAQRLNLDSSVQFLGALSRRGVRDALSNADAFILASHHETFGIVFIEALSQGIPVIATRSGGPEDIVTPDDGILVAPNDENALANAIAQLAHSIGQYDRDDLSQRASKKYSETPIVSELTKIYRSAIDRGMD